SLHALVRNGLTPRGASHRDGTQHGARLVDRLLILQLGHRVGDETGAGLYIDRVAAADERADRDREIEVAGVADVADRAAVDRALVRLELVDDLHRANLGRARERAGRKCGAQDIDPGAT